MPNGEQSPHLLAVLHNTGNRRKRIAINFAWVRMVRELDVGTELAFANGEREVVDEDFDSIVFATYMASPASSPRRGRARSRK